LLARGLGREHAPPPPLSVTVEPDVVVVLEPPEEVVPPEVAEVVVFAVVDAPASVPLSCDDEHAPTDTMAQLVASAPHAPNRQALFDDLINPPTKFE
jgi:hypothetical protein